MHIAVHLQPLRESKTGYNSQQNIDRNVASCRSLDRKRKADVEWVLSGAKRECARPIKTDETQRVEEADTTTVECISVDSRFSINGILRAYNTKRLYVDCIQWVEDHMRHLRARFIDLGRIAATDAKMDGATKPNIMRAATQLRSANRSVQRSAVTDLLAWKGISKIMYVDTRR